MKKKWVVPATIIVIILWHTTLVTATDSSVSIYVSAYDSYTHEKSKYSYPNMREDDFFVVEKVKISNINTSEKDTLIIKFLDGNNIEKRKCLVGIPEIAAEETQEISLTAAEGHGNWPYTCYLNLDKIDGWTLSLEVVNGVRSWGSVVISEDKPYGFNFKVTSKYILEALELNEKAIDVSWKGAIIGGMIGAVIGFSLAELSEFLRRKRLRKNALKSLIYELNTNREFAKRLVNEKETYLKGDKCTFDEFLTLNLEAVLKGNHLENAELVNELFEYFSFFKIMNNFIYKMRSPVISTSCNALGKVIVNIEAGDIINKMEKLLNKLNQAI